MERMFEPFFTTKEVGKGTGLGLAAVHGIVAAHGGIVAASSKPGEGTTFEVFIPTIAAAPASEARAVEEKPSGHEAIMIVDDEPQVCAMLAKMLSRLGYQVECFTCAPAAIEAFQRDPSRWALAITDQTMPQMSGLEFAKTMLAQAPNMPVILCSGYTDMVSSDSAASAGVKAFLTKPVDHATLARMIRELLDRPPPMTARGAQDTAATNTSASGLPRGTRYERPRTH
jgi:FixJ family two-component response regulator